MSSLSILFVCMGNICRSPTAHGVFRHKVAQAGLAEVVRVDSAGTHNYHPGSAPDDRSISHALKRGYDLQDLRARQITDLDFDAHDLVLAMDWDNLALVQHQCPPQHQRKVKRFIEFCLELNAQEVPDPYYGGASGFEHVLDVVEDASNGLLVHVQSLLRLNPVH
jgi:protein-tyrosine phosphatase